MRGGNSDAFLVIADAPVAAPPVVGSAWGALVMHHEHAQAVWPKLDAGGAGRRQQLGRRSRVPPGQRGGDRRRRPGSRHRDRLSVRRSPHRSYWSARSVARTGIVSREALLWPRRPGVLPSYRGEAAAANGARPRAWTRHRRRPATRLDTDGGELVTSTGNEPIRVRGTVVIDIEACKGCDLCIEACKPAVLSHDLRITPTLAATGSPCSWPAAPPAERAPTCVPTSASRCSASTEPRTWTAEAGLL